MSTTKKLSLSSLPFIQGINLATNAFLQAALGPDYQAQLLGLMEMPKVST